MDDGGGRCIGRTIGPCVPTSVVPRVVGAVWVAPAFTVFVVVVVGGWVGPAVPAGVVLIGVILVVRAVPAAVVVVVTVAFVVIGAS